MKSFLPKLIVGSIVWGLIFAYAVATEQDRIDQLTLLCQLEPNDPVCATLPKE